LSLLSCLSAFAAPSPAAPTPAADSRILPITENAYAGSSVNVVANIRSSLFTHSTVQYGAFYDADGYLVLARRPLGVDAWELRRTEHRGNVADAHNSVSIAVDGAGYLHVAWDHHASPLHYARSVAPGSIELAPPSPMLGEREASVTYPQFHLLPNGDLLFLYRDGASGKGSLILNRYTTATAKWSVVQPSLIDGEGKRSPYWDLCVDAKGTLHLAWIWRDSPDVSSNHDLAYATSKDGGATWKKTDGSMLALPITAASAEYAQRIPTGSNLMNSPMIAADSQGHPSICTYWSPTAEAAPQFQIVQHDGKGWTLTPGPAAAKPFSLAGTGTKHPPISRAALLIDTSWQRPAIHLIYRDDARGGHAVLATRPAGAATEWTTHDLNTEDLGAWEPSVDPVLWHRFSQAHFLVQRVTQRDGDDKTSAAQRAPIASLIWAPATARMRSQTHDTAVSPDAAAESDSAASIAQPIDRAAVLAVAQRVADWQWAHFPTDKQHHPRDWTIAPFYVGVLAIDRISPDHRNRDRMLQQAEELKWQPHDRIYHADDHAVSQAYLELYHDLREPRMIAPTKERFDYILAHPSTALFDWGTPKALEVWSWCDALFMGPVAWLELWRETGDKRYLDFMNREWWRTTERLYRPSIGFYFRDESYLDLREPNGKTIHWSRGNGWVFAGLARVLELFPKDHPDYPKYVQLYREMAAAVLAAQQPDGLWRVGLLDPTSHPSRETSGSSFYTFGLTWGVNHGLLEKSAAMPAIERAWRSLNASVTADGKLENVQPIGAAPEGFDPHHTDTFAVGAFLLAASEVYRLAK
jgi:rhamnogalacturonyl hydrolase YesR